MKKLVVLFAFLTIAAFADPFGSGPAALTLAGGQHVGSELTVNLYPNVILNAAGARGDYGVGLKANFLGIYLNGRDETLFGVEGRYRSNGSIGRFHVSTSRKIKDMAVTGGVFAGSDLGCWGKIQRGKWELALGDYDYSGSRAGLYYHVRNADVVGAAYSSQLGVYASYTHIFYWRKP